MAKRKQVGTEEAQPQAQPPPPDSAPLPDATPAEPAATARPSCHSDTGNGEKKLPAYKVGPILTDRNNSVSCAVWANEIRLRDGGTFTAHTVTVQASYRDSDGTWKSAKGFRGSQLYAALYCLQRASDFILSQRDPANDCPF